MVGIKKTVVIILIFAFSLSLIPNFLYNGGREVLGDENPCAGATCPAGCEPKAQEETGTCACINCPIPCQFGTEIVTNKSCLPMSGELEEWTCGKEIPIGEAIDRSAILASKMLAEFNGIIESGQIMVEKTETILNGNPEEGVPPIADWECGNMCSAGCYKYFSISAWERVEGPPGICGSGPQPPGGIAAKKECQEDASQCETCAQCRASQSCCWETTFAPDPDFPENTVKCKYCPQAGACQESCSLYWCDKRYDVDGSLIKPGCCDDFFNPIINGYSNIKGAQEDLKNDIDEKYSDGGVLKDLPDKFKFKRSYILEQLDFARCELAQCWIPAEDYPAILSGEKSGKHLFTCKSVSDMGLFEDDQLVCSATQIMDEWEEVQELWGEMLDAPWWQKPIIFFQVVWKTLTAAGQFLWGLIKEWFDVGKEEGCYPTNYYCCHF